VFARKLVNKVMSVPAEDISTKEDQAFIYLLSTAVLHHQFGMGQESYMGDPSPARPHERTVVDNRTGRSVAKVAR
jgi:asparagine synthase (glutamine-hydrolysing)